MTNKIDFLSVIIVIVEEGKEYLKECLLSLEKSAEYARVSLEIIIILNDAKLIYPKYLKSKIKFIRNKTNVGFGKAVNLGMSKAKGKWCLLVNPDTITYQSSIKNLIKHITYKNVAVISPKILNSLNNIEYNILPFPTLWNIFLQQSYLYKTGIPFLRLPNSDRDIYLYNHEVDAIAGTYWLVKKEIFLQIGGFDPQFFMYFEDIDFCSKLKEKGLKIFFVSSTKIDHLGQMSSREGINGKIFSENFYKYLTKNSYLIIVKISLYLYLIGSVMRYFYWKIKPKIIEADNLREISTEKEFFYKNTIKFLFTVLL